MMDVEDTFKLIGRFGLQQKLYFLIFGLKDIWIAGPIFHMVFVSIEPKQFICHDLNGTIYNNTCPENNRNLCSRVTYFYEHEEASSIIDEWNLICDEAYKIRLVQSIYMSGVLCGAVAFGVTADVLGRLKTFTVTIFLCAFLAAISSLAPTFFIYSALRFLIGMCIQGSGLSCYVLFLESIGSSIRGVVCSWWSIFFTTGLIMTTCIAYAVRGWRLYAFITSVWGIVFTFIFCCVYESPRWLLTNGFSKKAEVVMLKIAKKNRTDHKIPEDWSLKTDDKDKPLNNSDSLYMFFSNWKLFQHTAIQFYSWFVSGAMYYGLTIGAGKLGDVYINNILLALVEIPALFLQVLFINRIGRRRLVCIFMSCGGIACLVIQFLPSGKNMAYVRTTLALIGKLCSAGQFGVIYVYTAELFPTSLRNGAIGMVSVAARFGGILCPFIVLMGDYISDIQFTVFGAMAFTAGIANLWLPETNKCPLPDCVDNLLYPERYLKELTVITELDEGFSEDEILDTAKILNNK